ncbi:hypothetical protein Tco_0017397 [Tanacetum coccineum]
MRYEEPNEGTDENLKGTKEQNEDTVEIFEGTEEQREGTEEKVEMNLMAFLKLVEFKQLKSDEELARKVQAEWEEEEERNRVAANEDLIRDFDDIKARIEADMILLRGNFKNKIREQFIIE